MSSIEILDSSPGAVLRFTGEDHAAFLQGQATADLRGPDGRCAYSLFLDHQGRILADGFVLNTGGAALLVSYACPAAGLRAKFERHIIADDVAVEDLTSSHRLLSVNPAHATAAAAAWDFAVPSGGRFARAGGGFAFSGRRLGPGTLDLLLPAGAPLPAAAAPLDARQAEWLRVGAGIPLVPADTEGGLNPVEAGVLSAVSFTKGCYLGQEVVARVHRLARARLRMVRLTGLPPAMRVPGPLMAAGEEVGAITSVAESGDTAVGLGRLKARVGDGAQDFGAGACMVKTLPSS